MKKLKPWLESLRLSVTIPAGVLSICGFIIAKEKINWFLVVEVILVCGFAMLQNDYVDRFHDIKKGKYFAYNNKKIFFVTLVLGWTLILSLALIELFAFFRILLPVIMISILYSYIRKTPVIQILCVALTSASPIIIPLKSDLSFSYFSPNSIIFLAVFMSIFAREMIKDIEDAEIDVGYKKTLLSMGLISKTTARQISAASLATGVYLSIGYLFFFSHGSSDIKYIVFSTGILLCSFSSMIWLFTEEIILGKKFFDYGMLLILAGILLN